MQKKQDAIPDFSPLDSIQTPGFNIKRLFHSFWSADFSPHFLLIIALLNRQNLKWNLKARTSFLWMAMRAD
ncbi:MAG TPA: hypothetical protein DF984_07225 [Anaerolineaceae bacterium]|nr:hypothetical protein [Anaerolineaceae bacterium]